MLQEEPFEPRQLGSTGATRDDVAINRMCFWRQARTAHCQRLLQLVPPPSCAAAPTGPNRRVSRNAAPSPSAPLRSRLTMCQGT